MNKFTKSLFFVLMISCFGYVSKSNAQVDVTIDPVSLLWGNISLGADFALSENFSIEGQLGYSRGDWGTGKYTGIPVTVFGKYYFSPKNGADRFYLSVFTRFINRSYSDNNDKYSLTRLGLGVGIGYKVVSAGNFVFDIGFGVGRSIVSFDNNNNTNIDWIPVMFAGKLGVGYRF